MDRLGTTRGLLVRVLLTHLIALAAGTVTAAGFWLYLALPECLPGEMLVVAVAFFCIAALGGSLILWWLLRPTVRDLDRALVEARVLGELSAEATEPFSGSRTGMQPGKIGQFLHLGALRVQALLDEQARERDELTALLVTMAEGVVVTGKDGQILLANPAAGTLLGASLTTGRPLVEAARDYEIHQLVERCVATGQLQTAELSVSSTGRQLGVTSMPVAGSTDGRILLVIYDLTEARRVERTRREFVANVSHELRTPLTTMKASADTLLEGALDDPAAARTFLHRITHEVDRMTLLVADLLELSRLESGHILPQLTPVALSSLIDEAASRFQSRLEANGLTLVRQAESDLPKVVADTEMVRQVLSNLLDNAIKYTPRGGTIAINTTAESNMVVTAVADTGVGIPREHISHVFERFYKVERSRREGGTGLGLAIVKHIVQAHGGEVRVESREGEGSVFSFSLPAAPTARSGSPASVNNSLTQSSTNDNVAPLR
ncbi:MAG: GHKL domain-containing protein [Dehalococcoidia bacterium]|nr:GHKL domain-containing protein [Dehalococcoidia bacterium]